MGKKQHIAIVDDDTDNLNLFSEALESFGFKTIKFEKALDASEYLSSHHLEFSMVIVDLQMSDMSGEELINLISGLDDKIKIIVLSASSKEIQSRDIQKYENLQKPVLIGQLIDLVKRQFLQ